MPMLNPNPDILLYTAIGDAYCLATEYIPDDSLVKKEALKFKQYLSHPKYGNIPGTYSDDAQMSSANVEVLLGSSWEKIDFANSWVKTYKRDPRDAYSRRFQEFLNNVSSGEEFLNTIDNQSNKNGGAMRSAVFGVLPTPEDVLNITTKQASITHNTPGGLFAAQAVALMSHFALYENQPLSKSALGGYLDKHLKVILNPNGTIANNFSQLWAGRVAGEEIGIITAYSTFTLLTNCNSMLEILKNVIEWGGDTDSVAAISLGIASCRFPDDLPAFMHNQLEVGSKYGSDFLKDLGKRLMMKFA